MIIRNLFICIFMCFLPSIVFAGTAFYVDPSVSSDGKGTFSSPWKFISTVNAHLFSTGDDLYFKAGTTCKADAQLNIRWTGSPTDQVIIGAYYGNGKFGLNGGARPIIDGTGLSISYGNGIVRAYGLTGYITFKDLQIQNSTGAGIEMDGRVAAGGHSTGFLVDNCYIKNTSYQGILLARSSDSTIQNNIVERASNNRAPGAGIEVTGTDDESTTLNNTISGNTVYWCYEGIGMYRGARYSIAENNVIYDCRSFHLYVANSRNAILRNNIIYETPNQLSGDALDYLVATDCEGHENVIKLTGNVEIYGNYIAGGNTGIALLSNSNSLGIYQSNNYIHDNVIVDCNYNFFFNQNVSQWTGNVIEHNVSYTLTSGAVHSNNYSPYGVKWGVNNFDDSVTGNAAVGAYIGVVLVKQSGWRTLPAGRVDPSYFNYTTDGITALTKSFGYGNLQPPSDLVIQKSNP